MRSCWECADHASTCAGWLGAGCLWVRIWSENCLLVSAMLGLLRCFICWYVHRGAGSNAISVCQQLLHMLRAWSCKRGANNIQPHCPAWQCSDFQC